MRRIFLLGSLFAMLCAAMPAQAGEFWHFGDADEPCYWCIRDGIYRDVKMINHFEANPDVDEAIKGPYILAARADIHRLRRLLGPVQYFTVEPCCYSRRRLAIH